MLMIRLFRTGKKNQPSFKIVVTEKTNSSTRGRSTEEVGFYNPVTKEKVFKKERIVYWINKGAQPSDTVYNILVGEKIIEGKKKTVVLPKKAEPVAGKNKAAAGVPAAKI
ncbi:MAG: 30S ribosomal protein S16 [Candidatus Paceibacterota bacterium]|jgi:small subunit ribosomal protein S16